LAEDSLFTAEELALVGGRAPGSSIKQNDGITLTVTPKRQFRYATACFFCVHQPLPFKCQAYETRLSQTNKPFLLLIAPDSVCCT